ncbi:hypothetical protein IF2G_08057 [Cordyceps javanica]|nr:hypothetical protein IF2G_08057 [Cordyceps javanica]
MGALGLGLTHLARLAHLLAFSSLFGGSLFHTFVVTKVAFRVLPRRPFSDFQARLFPVYFRGQLVALSALIFTYPSTRTSCSRPNTTELLLLGVSTIACVLNDQTYGPRTSEIMQTLNKTLAVKDVDGEYFAKLKREFSSAHAMSIHLNLISMVTATVYGLIYMGRIHS